MPKHFFGKWLQTFPQAGLPDTSVAVTTNSVPNFLKTAYFYYIYIYIYIYIHVYIYIHTYIHTGCLT